MLAKHPEVRDIFIDGTERPVERKQKYEQQKKDYSWKKKRHTMKNTVVAGDNKIILWVSKTENWSKHDNTMLKESEFMRVLLWYTLRVDLGYYWVTSQYPNNDIMIPHKKPKWTHLTESQKNENHTISWIRVLIENIIGRVKKYRIIANKYRNRTVWNFRTVEWNMKHVVMLVACGLHNLNQSKYLFA